MMEQQFTVKDFANYLSTNGIFLIHKDKKAALIVKENFDKIPPGKDDTIIMVNCYTNYKVAIETKFALMIEVANENDSMENIPSNELFEEFLRIIVEKKGSGFIIEQSGEHIA